MTEFTFTENTILIDPLLHDVEIIATKEADPIIQELANTDIVKSVIKTILPNVVISRLIDYDLRNRAQLHIMSLDSNLYIGYELTWERVREIFGEHNYYFILHTKTIKNNGKIYHNQGQKP